MIDTNFGRGCILFWQVPIQNFNTNTSLSIYNWTIASSNVVFDDTFSTIRERKNERLGHSVYTNTFTLFVHSTGAFRAAYKGLFNLFLLTAVDDFTFRYRGWLKLLHGSVNLILPALSAILGVKLLNIMMLWKA